MSRPKARTGAGLTIGRLAALIGMTPSAMRFYEDKGIVAPGKLADNNYRSYTPAESCALLTARRCQGFGISLEKTARLIGAGDSGELGSALAEREAELEEEIRRLAEARLALRSFREELAETLDQGGVVAEARLPAMKYVFTIESGFSRDEPARRALVREWMSAPARVTYALLISAGTLRGEGEPDCRWGFAMEAEGLDPQEAGIVEHYPAQDCVAFSFARTSAGMLRPEELEEIRARVASTGRRVEGDLRGSFLGAFKLNGAPRYVYRIYVPALSIK